MQMSTINVSAAGEIYIAFGKTQKLNKRLKFILLESTYLDNKYEQFSGDNSSEQCYKHRLIIHCLSIKKNQHRP